MLGCCMHVAGQLHLALELTTCSIEEKKTTATEGPYSSAALHR